MRKNSTLNSLILSRFQYQVTWHIQFHICPHMLYHRQWCKIDLSQWCTDSHKPNMIKYYYWISLLLPTVSIFEEHSFSMTVEQDGEDCWHDDEDERGMHCKMSEELFNLFWTLPCPPEQCHRQWHSEQSVSRYRESCLQKMKMMMILHLSNLQKGLSNPNQRFEMKKCWELAATTESYPGYSTINWDNQFVSWLQVNMSQLCMISMTLHFHEK